MGFYVPTHTGTAEIVYPFPYIQLFQGLGKDSKSLPCRIEEIGGRSLLYRSLYQEKKKEKQRERNSSSLWATHGLEVNAETVKVDEVFVAIRAMREPLTVRRPPSVESQHHKIA